MTDSKAKFEVHLSVDGAGHNAVGLLCESSGLSRNKIKQSMVQGAVWLTRGRHTARIRRASKSLKAGDELHLYYDVSVLGMQPEEAQLIADEQHYSVWNKPYGMLSQGSKWGDHCTITRWVEGHLYPKRPAFVVHRLDRAATGLILIAHGKRAAAALSALFQQRQIEKCYRVTVEGCFPDSGLPLRLDEPIDGRHAVTQVIHAMYEPDRGQTQLDIRIETGRKHQIRRHLADYGYPVVGDRLYGTGVGEGQNGGAENLQLCCNLLAFRCPFSGHEKVFRLSDSGR